MTQPAHLERALLEFYKLDENIRVATVLVFVEIARCEPQGTTVKALMDRLGLAQPAVNRAILRLSSRGSESHAVGDPLGIVSIFQDPEETRRHLVTLSAKGRTLCERIGLSLK